MRKCRARLETSQFQRGFEDIPAREVQGLATPEVIFFASLNLDLEVFGGVTYEWE